MALSQQQLQEFEDFFSGEMKEDEKISFYRELASKPGLQEEFELEKMLRGYTGDMDFIADTGEYIDKKSPQYLEDKETVSQFYASIKPLTVKKIMAFGLTAKQLSIAASVAGILLVSSVLYLVNREWNKPPIAKKNNGGQVIKDTATKNKPDDSARIQKPDELLLAYNENYSRFLPNNNYPVELQYPIEMYANKKYNVALTELNGFSGLRSADAIEEKKAKVTVDFYKGLCLLELNKNGEALNELVKAYKNRDSLSELKEDIMWYYSLACLKNNNKDSAVSALGSISSSNPKYGKKVIEILKSLAPE